MLFLLSFMATTSFATGKTGTPAPLKSVEADDLTPPTFSSADASNETWYYIRFARQAVQNLVWSTDYPSNNDSWAIKQLTQKTDDKHTQHWKLVGSLESFYIVNRATGFNVIYAATEDAAKGIRGGNYIVGTGGEPGAVLELVRSTDCVNGSGVKYTGPLSWVINNPSVYSYDSHRGYMNDRGSIAAYPWRDVCFYYAPDDGFLIEFVQAEGHTIVIPTDSLATIEAPVGETGKGVYAGIASFGLTENITATIDGADASAFGFAGNGSTLPAAGGSLTLTFSPQEARVYHATLTLSSEGATPCSIRLSGNGFDPSELPRISSYDNPDDEYYYYIQFHRRATAGTVWALNDTTNRIVQDTLKADNIQDNQQWKIYGNWEDGYTFVNKSDETEMYYNQTASSDGTLPANSYLKAPMGDVFDFVRFNADGTPTKDWQLLNRSFVESGATSSWRYVDDEAGRFLCNYLINTEGNRLKFIPVDASALIIPVDSFIFNAGLGDALTQSLVITGVNLTAPAGITVSISGEDAGIFTIADDIVPVTLPATGGKVNVRFFPSETGEYSAQLTVACEGYPDKQITLKGSCFYTPVKISKGTSEYWYRLQFSRKSGNVIVDKGLDQIIAQENIVDGAAIADNQLWKFTGTWDNYRIVAKSGREFKYDANADGGRYVAAATGTGNRFRLEVDSYGDWCLYNMTLTSGYRYLNDYGGNGTQIGNYAFDDGGNPFNFLANFPSVSANDFSFAEVETGATEVKTLNVIASLLTAPITYTLTNDGDAFTVSPANTLPIEGGTLQITFAPTEKRDYRAILTLSSDGADDLEVALTGTANFEIPVTISTTGNEVWYYVRFNRQSSLTWTAGEYGEAITQTAKTEDNTGQQWKFTGSAATGYNIANRNGGVLFYDSGALGTEEEPKLALLVEELSDADYFLFKRQGEQWQLKILGKDTGYEDEVYLNDYYGENLCLYVAHDGGNALVFTPVDPTGIRQPVLDVDGALVSVKYYNLQGMEVTHPAITGIYIVQNLYASGKVQTVKRMIVIR
jgi:hypothetical protein